MAAWVQPPNDIETLWDELADLRRGLCPAQRRLLNERIDHAVLRNLREHGIRR